MDRCAGATPAGTTWACVSDVIEMPLRVRGATRGEPNMLRAVDGTTDTLPRDEDIAPIQGFG